MALSLLKRKYLYWAVSFISITVILLSIYSYLGGFEDFNAGRSSASNYSIAGKWVKGKGVRKSEGEIFYSIKQDLETGKLKGKLGLVDFKNDTLEEHEICRFIGIILENNISALPSGYDILELKAETTYKASLTMHPLVMPSTRDVENKLTEVARKNQDRLRPLTIETFFNDNSVMVEMFAY